MRPSTQRFKPDTCGCVFDQVWDKDNPGGGFLEVTCTKACPAHDMIPIDQIWHVVWAGDNSEQKRKNIIQKRLMESTRYAILPEDYEWSFAGHGENRVLTYGVKGRSFGFLDRSSLNGVEQGFTNVRVK